MTRAHHLTRRTVLAGGLGLVANGLLPAAAGAQDSSTQPWHPPPPGALPGVGAWEGQGVSEGLADCGARWYYTWAPDHRGIETPGGCEFVPMIWGENDLTDDALHRAKSNGTVLLGFNEPDAATQADMSVEAALEAWPRLQQTGLSLGAPAVATHGDVPGQ